MHPLQQALRNKKDSKKSVFLQRFFKTGKNGYAEDDGFIGLTVPQTRAIAKQFINISFQELLSVIHSPIHEERLAALVILVHQFEKHPARRKEIFDFFLNNIKFVNNWDLVDLSAHKIVGRFIFEDTKDISLLIKLSKSENLWERRIAMISTAYFISKNEFDETIQISELLLKDKHDLIHKAVGWMLREVGKRDLSVLKSFLKKHYKTMPRTMLRYAIERFPEKERKEWLQK